MEVNQHYQNEIISIINAELISGYIKKNRKYYIFHTTLS